MSSEDLKSSADIWGGDIPTRVVNPSPSRSQRPSRSAPAPTPAPAPSDEPPSYNNIIEEAPQDRRRHLNPIEELNLLSSIDFSNYNVPGSTPAADRFSMISNHQLFYTSPTALSNLLGQQSIIPPRPLILIKGSHADNNRVIQTDFDLTLNLTTLLEISQKASTPSRLRLTPPPSDPQSRRSSILKRPAAPILPPLDQWCKIFTSDKSENKSLTLTRLILDFPSSSLEGAIRTLLHTLKYRGKLEVSFPIQYQSVTVHKAPSNWLYNMLRLYPVKEYKIAESVWEIRGADDGSSQKVIEEWWDEWKGPIANAILNKTQGKIGVEEWIEWKMGIRQQEKKGEWAVDGQWEWAAGS